MKILIQEERFDFLKVLTDKIKEHTDFDKFNRVALVRYEISDNTFFDINGKTKKQQKHCPALIYNLPSVLKSIKEDKNQPIVIVENEKLADYINKKCKNVVATTITNNIDREDISEKTLELLRNTNVYILCYYSDEHKELRDKLSLVTEKVTMISSKNTDTTDVSKEINHLLKIVDNFRK